MYRLFRARCEIEEELKEPDYMKVLENEFKE